MTTALRSILIDDVNSAIHYSAGWIAANTTQLNEQGNYGPVYGGTTHATTTTGSDLTFEFSGTSIAVFGTINFTDPNGATWKCLIDGNAIPEQNPTFQFPENNWNLCAQSQLSAGKHNLTINVQTTGQAFYFDYLLYTPTDDVDLDGAVLEYWNTDDAVSFQSEWKPWGGQNVTQVNGASVTLDFHGTAVTLIGYVPQELPGNQTFASYVIDGGASTSFSLVGLAPGTTTTLYTIPILQLGGLTPASHSLVVTYDGDSDHTPLPVGRFYVTNAGASPPPPPNAPNSPSLISTSLQTSTATTIFAPGNPVFTTTFPSVRPSPSVSPTPAEPARHHRIDAIVCASIGGLVLCAFLAGVAMWYRKRRRRVSAARTPVPFLVPEGELAARSRARYMVLLEKGMGPGVDPGAGMGSAPRGGHGIPVVQQQTLDTGLRNPRGFASARKLLRQPGPEVVALPPGYQS